MRVNLNQLRYFVTVAETESFTKAAVAHFISQTAITQHHTIFFYRDPFKLVPVSQLADIADKFRRNEIMTSNEIRAIVGYKPSDDPNADELRNKNLNQSPEAMMQEQEMGYEDEELADGDYGE